MPQGFYNDEGRYTCCQCNEVFDSPSHFFKKKVGLYSETGYLPVCKNCLIYIYKKYIDYYGDARMAMKRICMAFDLYYKDGLYEMAMDASAPEKVIGDYFRKLNMKQHKNKTFDDTLKDGFYFREDSKVAKIKEAMDKTMKSAEEKAAADKPEVTPKDINRWGYGFEPTDYGELNKHYKLLKDANPNCDSNQEIFINDLCYIKMQQMKAVREGKTDDFNKMTESYRKTFTQAGLKTVRDVATTEDFTFGVNIEMIEKYTPAEYYKDKKLYKDFDGIGDYITRFLLRPLRNLQHGMTDRDHEYYVKDEDDVDESI